MQPSVLPETHTSSSCPGGKVNSSIGKISCSNFSELLIQMPIDILSNSINVSGIDSRPTTVTSSQTQHGMKIIEQHMSFKQRRHLAGQRHGRRGGDGDRYRRGAGAGERSRAWVRRRHRWRRLPSGLGRHLAHPALAGQAAAATKPGTPPLGIALRTTAPQPPPPSFSENRKYPWTLTVW